MDAFRDPIHHFRHRREQELFEHRFSVRADEAQREVLRLLEQSEKKEELARKICHEMEEFFKDSTRIAARVFGSIEEKEAHVIEDQVRDEMKEFFTELERKAEELIQTLWERDQAKLELAPALENLLLSSKEPLEKTVSSVAEHMEDLN